MRTLLLVDRGSGTFRRQRLGPHWDKKFIIFWNNRNARRKMSGSVVYWFNNFLNKVGRDKAMLLMHTNPKDENGQDLEAIAKDLGMNSDEILFSNNKLNFDQSLSDVEAEKQTYTLKKNDCTIDGDLVQFNFYQNTAPGPNDVVNDGEPDSLEFDIHFVKNETGIECQSDPRVKLDRIHWNNRPIISDCPVVSEFSPMHIQNTVNIWLALPNQRIKSRSVSSWSNG